MEEILSKGIHKMEQYEDTLLRKYRLHLLETTEIISYTHKHTEKYRVHLLETTELLSIYQYDRE